jgi:tetrahydromethanopterin S-methyltransferase subunit A
VNEHGVEQFKKKFTDTVMNTINELFEQITKIVHENKEHQDACERDKMINLVEAEQEAIIERHKK